jgi:hypothetical protein
MKNPENRGILPHHTTRACYSARDFAFNKLQNLKMSRDPPTYARAGAVKSEDFLIRVLN